jgi:uncharacterized circularly permuted ATP-grasp superfamily protein/uncharacterized alpha-E superfamily protein
MPELSARMPRTLLSVYPRSLGRYDELLAAGATVRAHWQSLLSAIDASTPEQMRERFEYVERRIRENGTTYRAPADPKGTVRQWQLDPVPLALPAAEWRQIEQGVTQRARLLEAVLADLYGPQALLKSGALPPGLILGHHSFLWPGQGVAPAGGRFLYVYAVDLARAADGQWTVLADHTQSPMGFGYALENRLVVSRVFPELFRDQHVLHLADFFRAVQESLAAWSPLDAGEKVPLIVLLTPGPADESFFEHSYLARHLGFPLVEGRDLTVRGDTLYLKTLAGLQRVHAVLRRTHDEFCDPLELRADSTLGVPGLVQVARAQRVLIANALGSGVLESAGVLAFLPRLAETLLGEALALPAVPTSWCGEAGVLKQVERQLEKLVIKPAYPSRRFDPVFGNSLDASGKWQWIERLRQFPSAYAAQELVRLSQAPVASRALDRRLLGRSCGLTVYAVATPQGWHVMPGGMARVAGSSNVDILSMARGGSSKDVWVLADGPLDAFSLSKSELGVADVIRTGSQLPSRTAENLFRLGRYVERAEKSARLLRMALSRQVNEGDEGCTAFEAGEPSEAPHDAGGEGAGKTALPSQSLAVRLCEHLGLMPLHDKVADGVGGHNRLLAGVFSEEWSGSLKNIGRQALGAANQIRERLSFDHWHSLNRQQDALVGTGGPVRLRADQALAMLDRMLLASASQAGFAMDDMMRDTGWRFMMIGRCSERLHFLARAIARVVEKRPPGAAIGIACLLELANSSDTYRHRYRRAPEIVPALDLLIFDPDNPHSITFQSDELERYLSELRREFAGPNEQLVPAEFVQAARFLRDYALNAFEGGAPAVEGDAPTAGGELARRLTLLVEATSLLDERLANRFFAETAASAPSVLVA